MSRESFLARVRQAALSGRAYRVHVGELPKGTGYAGASSSDLCASFADQAIFVGGESTVVDGLEAARRQLAELLQADRPASAYCWRHELLDRLDLAGMLREMGIERIDYDSLADLPESERRAKILAAGCGVTSCDCAVAETGSLMVCSRAGQERVASLLPPWHVALVAESQIVPDLFDAFARLGVDEGGLNGAPGPLDLPSNVTFITGPSKTGDIELELTTGVHGPGVWRTIVIRGV